MSNLTLSVLPEEFVREFYTENAAQYIKYRTEEGSHHEDAILPILCGSLQNLNPYTLRVLDLGCGFKSYLQDYNFDGYVGIDLSEALLNFHPLSSCSRATLIQGDVESFNYTNVDYGLIFGLLSLNYVRCLRTVFDKVKRKNVSFFFAFPNPDYDRAYAQIDSEKIVRHRLGDISLTYYNHTLDKVIAALGNPDKLNINYTKPLNSSLLPTYVCFNGTW
jgi:SAM-dependent methyltransferase